ncbi:hypothetical protein N0V86_005432 [Didymella sp. IMI 355093]|nr:hypothetical protein N0V86_005432 [Didymella sp. IMI 355093]
MAPAGGWASAEVLQKVLVAMLASVDNKVDIHEMARLYGEGMTYNALENFLRKRKKEANELKEAAADRAGPAASTPRAKKNANGSSSMTSVKNARVTKPKNKITPGIKTELLGENSMLLDAASNGANSEEVEDEV